MTSLAYKPTADLPLGKPSGDVMAIYRIPQITIHAFCETADVTSALDGSFADRRMARADSSVQPGGIAAAIERYKNAASPSLVIVESRGETGQIRAQLNALADVCHASTKVIVIGHTNDVDLYRDLLAQGVSEYIVAPVDPISMIVVISRLYRAAGAAKLGKSFAFVGARGGVGSSSIAHNVAATIGRLYGSRVILADLDLPFGTAGLDFKLEPSQGVSEALQDPSRLDDIFLERLLNKRENHLSILSSLATLEQPHDLQDSALLQDSAFERLLDVAQANVPFVVLDVPHVWTSWARKTLLAADEVVITATPDLASLRNTKNLIDVLKQARPNDGSPKLVLNQVGVPKRAEIKPEKFAATLEMQPLSCIPFEALAFSTAANDGRMIAEASPKSKACSRFVHIAQRLTGRENPKTGWKERLGLSRLLKG